MDKNINQPSLESNDKAVPTAEEVFKERYPTIHGHQYHEVFGWFQDGYLTGKRHAVAQSPAIPSTSAERPAEAPASSGHTPGPWKVSDESEYKVTVYAPWSKDVTPGNQATYGDYRGSHVCYLEWNNGVPTHAQALANAELIARAPMMEQQIQEERQRGLFWLKELQEARAALQKLESLHEDFNFFPSKKTVLKIVKEGLSTNTKDR